MNPTPTAFASPAGFVEWLDLHAETPLDYAVGKSIEHRVVIFGETHWKKEPLRFLNALIPRLYEEAGVTWMQRVLGVYSKAVWLNPVPEKEWDYTYSIQMVHQLMGGRMYPLTLDGLDRAMRELVR